MTNCLTLRIFRKRLEDVLQVIFYLTKPVILGKTLFYNMPQKCNRFFFVERHDQKGLAVSLFYRKTKRLAF